ncbi:MAG: HDOD domain-containing protein [Burkholderiaceae bacterium]
MRGVTQAPPEAPAQADPHEWLRGPHRVDVAFFAWLLDSQADTQAPPGIRESRALQRLDRLAAASSAHFTLLPRAAVVVPRLLSSLRDASNASAQLAQYVSGDVTLVAETMRMANSPYYRRDEEAVIELRQALRLIGVSGLQSAIARCLLKPLIDGRSGKLTTRCAKRLWEHTEHKAQLCAAVARSEGLDPFEGYLAGLVHNAVWSALLRTMDGVAGEEDWRLSSPFVLALALRRDRLFETIAKQWKITDNLTRLASEVAQRGLAAATSAPAKSLCVGDRLASLLCARAEAHEVQEWLGRLDPPLLECYADVRRTQSAVAA